MEQSTERLSVVVTKEEMGLAQRVIDAIDSGPVGIDTIFVDAEGSNGLHLGDHLGGKDRTTLISVGALSTLEKNGDAWLDEPASIGPMIVLIERRRLSELLDVPVQIHGLLFTDANLSLVNEIVFVARQGHIVFPGALMPAILAEKFRSQLIERLTAPEQRVLWLLGFGHSNRTIANLLELPESTVKPLVRSTLMKLHFRNRTEAAVFASRLASRWATNPV